MSIIDYIKDDETLAFEEKKEVSYYKNEGERDLVRFVDVFHDDYYRHKGLEVKPQYKEPFNRTSIIEESYTIGEEWVNALPQSLEHISDAINNSSYILDLKEDWDDEGARVIPKNVYQNALNILISYSLCVFKRYKIKIKAPEINPGRDGSIDLDWRCIGSELLMSIQNNEQLIVHYYGDDGKSNTVIKGFLYDFSINEDLLFWMRKLQ